MPIKKVPVIGKAFNQKTGLAHTGVLPAITPIVCALLVKFGVVSAQTLDIEAVAGLTFLAGILSTAWSNWRTPKG